MRIHALLSADHKVGLGLGMRVGAPTLERWSAWLMREQQPTGNARLGPRFETQQTDRLPRG